MNVAKSRLRDYGLLAIFIAIAYWPLSSLHHITLWDSIEEYFPFRYFLSDCLRHGVLPLWNPYQMGGYPFYGDPQSGAWYLPAWIFCSIGPYNFTLFRIEYLLTFLIAATGMYELVRSFRLIRLAALIAAISYCSCGFFVSNAEHLTWVISAAWTPWVFWAYHRMHQTGNIGYALLVALFLLLLVSGGYPSFFIVISYLLLLFFLISILERRTKAWVWKSLRLHSILGLTFLMLGAGVLFSWYQAMPLTTRGSGVSLEQANICPFSPHCLLSFLVPFASLKDEGFYGTDIAMRNAYIGLSCLLALPFAFIAARNKKLLVLLAVLSLFCLLTAFGAYTPLRAWMYHSIPLMSTFRFPSMFRIYVIIGTILLAAHGADRIGADLRANRGRLIRVLIVLIAVYVILLSTSILTHGWSWHWGLMGANFEAYQVLSTRHENMQLQAITQLTLLSLLLLIAVWVRGKYFTSRLLVIFCTVDMAAATSMNAFSTIVSSERAPNLERPLFNAPHDFPVPDNTMTISKWRDERRNLWGLRTNTGIYFKTPAADGYCSFLLKSYGRLQRSAIHDSLEANPYLYFAGSISCGADTAPLVRKDEVRVNAALCKSFRPLSQPYASVRVLQFLPNRIAAVVSVKDSAVLNLQQNYAPGWKLFMDGKEAQILSTNYAQMGSAVPPGNHRLIWIFNPPYIRMLMLTSALSLLLLVSGFILFRKRLFFTIRQD